MKILNTTQIRFLIIVLIYSHTAIPGAKAQYYPGGLGNSKLKLWLTAADRTTLQKQGGAQAANGDFIAKWVDKSGNENHAVQATAGTRPVAQTGALNGNAAVIFQNANELLTGPSDAYQTIIGVRNMPGTGHYQSFFASPANQDFSIRGAGDASTYTDGPNGNDWTFNTGATPTQWTNGVQTLNGSNANHIIVASAANPTNATYSINSTFLDRGMNGNDAVYEILAYNTTFNTTQRTILENYEAAAWGLKSVLPTSGYTIFTPPSASTYNKNLIGIGYTGSTDNVLATATGSTDGLALSSTSGATGFLKTAGFLMAAHNGQNNTVINPATVPGVVSANPLTLWTRSWYLQKSGGNASGQIVLSFNFSAYNGATPGVGSVYTLLYNATNGVFSGGTNKLVSTVSSSVSGSTVTFTVSAANLSNGYYTILYSSTPIVLPLTLTDFTSSRQQNTSLLKWTATGTNTIDHFEIERAADGTHFSMIGTAIAGNDNTAEGHYDFTDANPVAALNYYRIKMVDGDGNATWSAVKTIDFATGQTPLLSLYPNPVVSILHIVAANSTGGAQVLITDIQGRAVRMASLPSSGTVDIPVNDLVKGIYVAEINTGTSKYTRTFIKN